MESPGSRREGLLAEEKKEEVDKCAFCLDDLIGSVNTVMTPCGHRYHCRCAITYAREEMKMKPPRERAECALCRTTIDLEPGEVQVVVNEAENEADNLATEIGMYICLPPSFNS